MPWRYSASKGTWRDNGGSSRKDLIKKRAKALRKVGWEVTVYKVKREGK
jgi:hypothetical protein